jgi:hypothetical protein
MKKLPSREVGAGPHKHTCSRICQQVAILSAPAYNRGATGRAFCMSWALTIR